jgi:sulfite reductase alpha subunit-like flavoprotein
MGNNLLMPNNVLIIVTVSTATIALSVYLIMGGFFTKSKRDEKSDAIEQKQNKKGVVDESSKYPAGSMIIYFGSQTGTAEGFARQLMNEGKSKGNDI